MARARLVFLLICLLLTPLLCAQEPASPKPAQETNPFTEAPRPGTRFTEACPGTRCTGACQGNGFTGACQRT